MIKKSSLKFFYGINLKQTIFDVIFFLYTIFVFKYQFSAGNKIIDFVQISSFNTNSFLILIFFIYVFITWFLGIVYHDYKQYTGKFLQNVILYIIALVVLLLYFGLTFAFYKFGFLRRGFSFVVLIVGGILLLFMGISLALREAKEKKEQKEEELGPTLMFLTIITLLYVVYAAFNAGKKYGIVLAIIFWLISTFLTFVIFTFIHYLKNRIKRILINARIFHKFVYGFKKIVVPFIAILLLCFLYEIYFSGYLNFLDENYYNFVIEKKDILISLIFAGIIPVRVVLLFSPPIRLLNIVSFLGVFYYFLKILSAILLPF